MLFFLFFHWRALALVFILGTMFFFCKYVVFPDIKNTGKIIENQQHREVWESSYRATALVREFRSSEVLSDVIWKEINKNKKGKK